MTVKEIITKLKQKKLSSVELIAHYADEIEKKDPELHSYLSLNDNLRQEAAEADEKFPTRFDFPLSGIPYAIKDNILADGMLATAGSKILENYKSAYDSTVVGNLKVEGAIILGKTNMDEFAMGSSTENSGFGPTKNPSDTSRVPGGSSGGSAAAVAAGLTPWALGSDTGGSIRQPAAFCGVVGFKPTYGAVSRHGLIAMASSLDQIGPLTQSVEDAKLIFPYLLGRDDMDATSIEIENLAKKIDPNKLKIGIVKEFFGEGLDERIKSKIKEALNVYKKMGAEVKEISLPYSIYSLAVYYMIMPSEASSNLARFDGIRYGKHMSEEFGGNLTEGYLKVRGEGFGKEVKRRIMLGTYVLSAGYYDAYYLKAQKVRRLIAQDFEKAFEGVDVIVSPTTPGLPFKFGEKTNDPLAMYLSDIYTVSANLVGLPAISIPVGNVLEEEKDLPVGMQLMSPHKKDYELLDIAELYEKESST